MKTKILLFLFTLIISFSCSKNDISIDTLEGTVWLYTGLPKDEPKTELHFYKEPKCLMITYDEDETTIIGEGPFKYKYEYPNVYLVDMNEPFYIIKGNKMYLYRDTKTEALKIIKGN